MKNITTGIVALAIATTGFFGFKAVADGGIKGTVTPAENAVSVSAISGTDTIKAAITNGAFMITPAKAGTYTIWVEASAPYKSTMKEGVTVAEDETVDVGEITLDKE